MDIGASHRLYETPFGGRKSTRLHPITESQLLDPKSNIWQRGNLYIRLFPEELRLCLGERLLRRYDRQLPVSTRTQAQRELKTLQKSMRRYFGRSGRPVGRPRKLTLQEAERMSDEHEKLKELIREHAGTEESLTQALLNQLFMNPEFLRALFEQFPSKLTRSRSEWEQWVQKFADLPFSERCLHYLAFQYCVSPETVKKAIWGKAPDSRGGNR